MSTEATELPDRTEVLVIGSGFGGSVVAAELATAGTQVCVVERGNEYPPGSFPRGPAEYATNFWDPHRGLFGMFDVWTFRGLETVVASGLGGGSLIYANVMLRVYDLVPSTTPLPARRRGTVEFRPRRTRTALRRRRGLPARAEIAHRGHRRPARSRLSAAQDARLHAAPATQRWRRWPYSSATRPGTR